MIRKIDVVPAANRDVEVISDWLAERSPTGLDHWIAEFEEALIRLASDAE